MNYSEWKENQNNSNLRLKYQKLIKAGVYEESEVQSLPDLEEISDNKGLVFFKGSDGKYGFYRELVENDEVYAYQLYGFEDLSDDEYNEVINSAKKGMVSVIGKVMEITGWVLMGVSLLLFFVTLFGGMAANTSEYAFILALFYSGAYFTALAISVLMIFLGRYLKCKDIL